jgi:hypothetical protein
VMNVDGSAPVRLTHTPGEGCASVFFARWPKNRFSIASCEWRGHEYLCNEFRRVTRQTAYQSKRIRRRPDLFTR